MWDVLDFALDIGSLPGMTELSSCDVDPLSILDTKAPPVQNIPLLQPSPPFILTLDLRKKS